MPRRCFRPKSCTWKRRWSGDEGGQRGQPQHQGSALPGTGCQGWEPEAGCRMLALGAGAGNCDGTGCKELCAGEGSLSRMWDVAAGCWGRIWGAGPGYWVRAVGQGAGRPGQAAWCCSRMLEKGTGFGDTGAGAGRSVRVPGLSPAELTEALCFLAPSLGVSSQPREPILSSWPIPREMPPCPLCCAEPGRAQFHTYLAAPAQVEAPQGRHGG